MDENFCGGFLWGFENIILILHQISFNRTEDFVDFFYCYCKGSYDEKKEAVLLGRNIRKDRRGGRGRVIDALRG